MCNSCKPYQFKVGDKGKTRDGTSTYEVLLVEKEPFANLEHVIIARRKDAGCKDSIVTRRADGRAVPHNQGPKDFMPPDEEVWVVLSKQGDWFSFKNLPDADKKAMLLAEGCLYLAGPTKTTVKAAMCCCK